MIVKRGAQECKNLREISKISKSKIYNSETSYPISDSKIQTGTVIGIYFS